MAALSALALGVYDVAKKQSLKKNGVIEVLFAATLLSTLLLLPFFTPGTARQYLLLSLKAVLVTASWVSGLASMQRIPLTTLSTIKASRPVFVVLFSVILFGERLSALQLLGMSLVFISLVLLGRTSGKEGISFSKDRGVLYAFVSVFTGVASALYDKQILSAMHLAPLFVQTWSNLFITCLLGLILLFRLLLSRRPRGAELLGGSTSQAPSFSWDWMLLAIAVLITVADALYFFALSQEDALLSIISMIRRGAVLVTFVLSAILFKEKRIKDKAVILAIMLCGVTVLLLAS